MAKKTVLKDEAKAVEPLKLDFRKEYKIKSTGKSSTMPVKGQVFTGVGSQTAEILINNGFAELC